MPKSVRSLCLAGLLASCGADGEQFLALPPEAESAALLFVAGGEEDFVGVQTPDLAFRRTLSPDDPLELAVLDRSADQLGLRLGRLESEPDWAGTLPPTTKHFVFSESNFTWQSQLEPARRMAAVRIPSQTDRWCRWSASPVVALSRPQYRSLASDGQTALFDDGQDILRFIPGSVSQSPQLTEIPEAAGLRLVHGVSTAMWAVDGTRLFRIVGSESSGFSTQLEGDIGADVFHAAHSGGAGGTILVSSGNGDLRRKIDADFSIIGNTLAPAHITFSTNAIYLTTLDEIFELQGNSLTRVYSASGNLSPPAAHRDGGILFGVTKADQNPKLVWLDASGRPQTLETFALTGTHLVILAFEGGFLHQLNFGGFVGTSAWTYEGARCDPLEIERLMDAQAVAFLPAGDSALAIRRLANSQELGVLGLHRSD